MWFINTRPQDRADNLTAALTAEGIRVKSLPLLELSACVWTPALATLYAELPQADMVVVVSPTAVRIGMQYLQQAGISLQLLASVQWIAVGKATAQVLAEYGISSHVPEVETSEGMLSLPLFQQTSVNTIAFWRGEGGRQFMMQHLQQQGVRILNFVLYQRVCPKETLTTWQEWLPILHQKPAPVWMLVTSEASWLNWLSLIDRDELPWSDFHFLVLGPRLSDLLQQADVPQPLHVLQLANLQPETILQQIKVWQEEA
ncbi:uroporphyrinogen-III synthase [Acinetobacter sp. GSS19]|uniref:uroporphyrinogen-III synthase n=1 Tax=Acinetobacter sp. GSS19 TaxID=3020716 RepID=UPI00236010B5|nr:uroporphyrinogen-III synthase [Acinetobacter sp. GSS19]